jgi:hypothetical protein
MDDGPRLKLSQVWPRFLRQVQHRQRRKHFVDKNTDHQSGIQFPDSNLLQASIK